MAEYHGYLGGRVKFVYRYVGPRGEGGTSTFVTSQADESTPRRIDVDTHADRVRIEVPLSDTDEHSMVMEIDPEAAKFLAFHIDRAAWILNPRPFAIGVGLGPTFTASEVRDMFESGRPPVPVPVPDDPHAELKGRMKGWGTDTRIVSQEALANFIAEVGGGDYADPEVLERASRRFFEACKPLHDDAPEPDREDLDEILNDGGPPAQPIPASTVYAEQMRYRQEVERRNAANRTSRPERGD